jgi:tetratricopeptide (TPR) repeat protein
MAPLLALLLAATAAPQSQRLTFAFIPPAGADDEARALGLVLQTRTSEALRATGLFNELHAKQMLSMAGSEAFKPDAFGKDAQKDADVAWYLGADAFLSGTLAHDKGWAFTGSTGVRGAPLGAIKPLKLNDKPVAALNQAIADIAKQVAALTKKKVAKWPDLTVGTASDAALLSYAKCLSTVVRQPMGIENPVTLNADAIQGAVKDCRAALEADPKFTAAKVALALALAIDGTDAEAAKLLSETGEQDSALYWVARFWLVTRYQSAEAGEGLLKQAIEKRPGFLLAQIYLCEDLTALGVNDKALAACEEAAVATPKGVFPLLRVGKALARLGKTDEAIKKSQDALALEPNDLKSREASLQLASRYIDAKKYSDAVGILEQIAHDENARGEELLRLGYAYQLKGENEKAKGLYESAIARATGPGEWRTRGRAYYDLALVSVKAGAKEKAKDAMRESIKTGFKARPLDPSLTDIAREVERSALSADPKAPAQGKPSLVPKEVNLFQVDASGELEVGPAGKEPPKDFVGIKF